MRDRPILFSAPMVRAILDGTKTQTRRVVKPQPEQIPAHVWKDPKVPADRQFWWPSTAARSMVEVRDMGAFSPYGMAGDRVWVRETWQYADWTEEGEPYIRYAADKSVRGFFGNEVPDGEALVDVWEKLSRSENYEIDNKAADRKWRPSIHMPRWASRLTLTITDVRVERLQDCSESDAEAEGIAFIREHPDLDETLTAPQLYSALWDSINGAGAWDANPWVWVVTFRRVDP